jgi:hypothetical protein
MFNLRLYYAIVKLVTPTPATDNVITFPVTNISTGFPVPLLNPFKAVIMPEVLILEDVIVPEASILPEEEMPTPEEVNGFLPT